MWPSLLKMATKLATKRNITGAGLMATAPFMGKGSLQESGMPKNPTSPTNPTTPTFDDNRLASGGYEKDTAQTTNVSLDDMMSELPQFRQQAGINMSNPQEVDVPMFGGASKKMGSIWDQLKGFGKDFGDQYKVNYRQALKDRGIYNEPQGNPYTDPNAQPDYEVNEEEYNKNLEEFQNSNADPRALYKQGIMPGMGGMTRDEFGQMQVGGLMGGGAGTGKGIMALFNKFRN